MEPSFQAFFASTNLVTHDLGWSLPIVNAMKIHIGPTISTKVKQHLCLLYKSPWENKTSRSHVTATNIKTKSAYTLYINARCRECIHTCTCIQDSFLCLCVQQSGTPLGNMTINIQFSRTSQKTLPQGKSWATLTKTLCRNAKDRCRVSICNILYSNVPIAGLCNKTGRPSKMTIKPMHTVVRACYGSKPKRTNLGCSVSCFWRKCRFSW